MFFYSNILFQLQCHFKFLLSRKNIILISNLVIFIQTHIYILPIQNDQIIQLSISILTIFQNENDHDRLEWTNHSNPF